MFRTSSVMGKLQIILAVFFGGVSCFHFGLSGSEVEVTVRPGDNITLYCDCRPSTGVYIVWFRNCFHEKQPPLVMNALVLEKWDDVQLPPRYKLVKNVSSDSYDLSIMNVSGSDEGFYYCGTKEIQFKDTKPFTEYIYSYCNIRAKLTLYSTDFHHDMNQTLQDCGWCWKLIFSLCPAVSGLSILIYHFCQKTASEEEEDPQHHQETLHSIGQFKSNWDEDTYSTTVVFRAQNKQTCQ